MRFPYSFTRYKGTVPAGGVVLGADTAPTTEQPSKQDHLISHVISNVNGWPTHRIAGVCRYVGGGNVTGVPVQMYMWEDTTEYWYKLGESVTMTPNGTVMFFDTVGPLEYYGTLQDLEYVRPGTAHILVIATDSGASNGTYTFAFCPDLTTESGTT